MSKVKLMIEIDEAIYNEFMKENDYELIYNGYWVAKAIAKGTPLPKGHGRLGDLDLLEKIVRADTNYLCVGDKNEALFNIVSLPTIVEADKDEQED